MRYSYRGRAGRSSTFRRMGFGLPSAVIAMQLASVLCVALGSAGRDHFVAALS